MKNTSLILGCGDIGTTLGLQLAEAGHRVIGVRRHPQSLDDTPIEPLALDLNDSAALAQLPEADIIVYVASADHFDETAYRAAYLDGLKAVLDEFGRRRRGNAAEGAQPTHQPLGQYQVQGRGNQVWLTAEIQQAEYGSNRVFGMDG